MESNDKQQTPKPNQVLTANLNTRVKLSLLTRSGEQEVLEFTLVADKTADFYAGYLGLGTPLAKAILGKTAGTTVPYRVGDTIAVKIETVSPAQEPSSGDSAARRQAEARQALDQINRTDAMIFTTTVEGKWGEYDPDAVD
jgi:hypothetical protein